MEQRLDQRAKQEQGQTIEAKLVPVKRTEVLRKLLNGERKEVFTSFIKNLFEGIYNNPQGSVTLWVVGETGAGKETIAGQILEMLLNQPQYQDFLKQVGENHTIKILSFGKAFRAAREAYPDKIVSAWSEFTQDEYNLVTTGIEKIVTAGMVNPGQRPILQIIEVPAVYQDAGYNMGATAIESIMKLAGRRDDLKQFVLALATDMKIQDGAMDFRDEFWTDQDNYAEAAERHNVDVVDVELTPETVPTFRQGMGNRVGRDRFNPKMTKILEEVFPFQKHLIRAHQKARTQFQVAYYQQLFERWRVSEGNGVAIANEPYSVSKRNKIHLFRGLMNKFSYAQEELVDILRAA